MTDTAQLVDLLVEKRVIPFIGAGFSMNCGLPSWRKLIDLLLDSFGIDKAEVSDPTDFLRVVEYIRIAFYLVNGGKVGPIRYEIQKAVNEQSIQISRSEPHLHLVSLHFPIIYTTNYDNLVETAYQYLVLPYNQVTTTRDIVAAANSNLPQVVKFHGSFEHEDTMVLTESDYFGRLELESPIDLKLRADILGKSVLFMGYGFADFNIRYLWFKLRQIGEGEVPRSHILMSEPDKVSEALFENMGITPILLSDYAGSTISERLCFFLESLIVKVNRASDMPFDGPAVATTVQIERLEKAIDDGREIEAVKYLWLLNNSIFGRDQVADLVRGDRNVRDNDLGSWHSLMEGTSPSVREGIAKLLTKAQFEYGHSCFYSILTVALLRYREVRDVEDMTGWRNYSGLLQQEQWTDSPSGILDPLGCSGMGQIQRRPPEGHNFLLFHWNCRILQGSNGYEDRKSMCAYI